MNVEGERLADHSVVDKLFQMTGPATAKLLILSMVLVLGTDSDPGTSGLQVLFASNGRDC